MGELIVSQSLLDDLATNEITIYANGADATTLGYRIPNGSSLKMVTSNRRVFLEYGYSDVDVFYRDGDGFTIYFTMGETNRIALLDRFDGDSTTRFTINTKLVEADPTPPTDPETPPIDGYSKGVNDVYRLERTQVRAFITDNFNLNNGVETVDYAKYILGLIELPFTIDESEVIGVQNIQLSTYRTNYTAELLKSDVIKFDLGTVEVPLNNSNSLDYKDKVCLLHIPYCEPLAIDSEYVLGEVVRVEFVVNLYDSLTTVNVYSTKLKGVELDGLVISKSIDLNASIPFATTENKPMNNKPDSVKLAVYNELDHVFIEVISNRYSLLDGEFTIPVVDECLIGECSGYVKVENINLKSHATTNEKVMMVDVLQSGIVINIE